MSIRGNLFSTPTVYLTELDQNGSQSTQKAGRPSKTATRPSEARSGIRQRKASREVLNSKPKHQAHLVDAKKQAQALAGVLELAQTQQQDAYQEGLEQLRAQLAEEIYSWKAEQQAREGLYMERIVGLEMEVGKLRTELTMAQQDIQQYRSTSKPTPITTVQSEQTEQQTQRQTQGQTQDHAQKQDARPKGASNQYPKQTTFADLAALLATKPGGQEWQEVPRKNKKHQKTRQAERVDQAGLDNLKPAKDCPKEARRLLFRREGGRAAPRSEREDIILATNRGLAKQGFPGFVRAVDAGYTSTGAITILLEKNALGAMVLPSYRDLLVAAVRQADPAIISAELPEQWYRVKVHGIPIKRYRSCGLGLAREEIELGTEFQLKRDPTWLRSSRELQNSNKKGSTIVITVGSLEEARRLLVNGIRFGGSRYRTEHYWEVGVDTVCPRCCHLGHRSFRACGDHQPCCFICAGSHEGNEHICRVVDCSSKPGTACQHIPAKCGNCGGPHPALAGNCPAKREARKRIMKRDNPTEKEAQQTQDTPQPEKRAGSQGGQELVAPSSPGFRFTIIDRDQSNPRARSSSVPTSPRTPRPARQIEDIEMRDTSILDDPTPTNASTPT